MVGSAEHYENICTCATSETIGATALASRRKSIRNIFKPNRPEKCKEHDGNDGTVEDTYQIPLNTSSSRKQSIQQAFTTFMSKKARKRASLPWVSGGSVSLDEPLQRQEDIEQGAFCDCLMGVINRNSKYAYLITQPEPTGLVRGSTL